MEDREYEEIRGKTLFLRRRESREDLPRLVLETRGCPSARA
jgi:hypothetical protein